MCCLQGVAINFVTNDDERLLQDIQRFYNTVIEVSSLTFSFLFVVITLFYLVLVCLWCLVMLLSASSHAAVTTAIA